MHKIHFGAPDPAGGAYDASQTHSQMVGDTPPHVSSLSTPSASRFRRIQNEVVIGPRVIGFPGPAMALDGPVSDSYVGGNDSTGAETENSISRKPTFFSYPG